jgi:hypothetical protein
MASCSLTRNFKAEALAGEVDTGLKAAHISMAS